MEKTVVLLGVWGEVASEEVDELQMAYGVVTHRPGYRKVTLSGSGHPEDDIEEQTRTVLSQIQRALEDLGGTMDDVTTLRIYVLAEVLSPGTQIRIHEVRSEFFEPPQYPAATMVGVADLLHDGMLIEIETEAEMPDAGWEVETITEPR